MNSRLQEWRKAGRPSTLALRILAQMDSADGRRFYLDRYEGPLDLLLYLIKKNEVDIHDIPIAKITEQFLSHLAYVTRLNLDDVTEFYVLAATLLDIKARMLLPRPDSIDDDDIEDPRKELVQRLIEYQRYRKLTDLMAEHEERSDVRLERSAQPTLAFVEEDDQWDTVEMWDLVRTFARLMANVSQDRFVTVFEEVTVNEKLTLLHELLETKGEFPFETLLRRPISGLDLVCAFLAVLDAARSREILIRQNRMFGDIRIVQRSKEDAVRGA